MAHERGICFWLGPYADAREAFAGESDIRFSINFHTETELEYVLIDPETAGVDVAHPRKLKLQDGRIPYTRTLFDEDALIFDNTQVERVGVEVDGKPFLFSRTFPPVFSSVQDELHAFFGFDANYSKETVKFQPLKYRNRVLFAVLLRFFFFSCPYSPMVMV